MSVHEIKRGLDLPVAGRPEPVTERAPAPGRVAVVAADYVGMKPTMHVQPGSQVRRGQLLFEDKKTPGVRYTSPAAGRVAAVNRGAKRALQSVVLELSRGEREGRGGRGDQVGFRSASGRAPAALGEREVKDLLLESGLWTALRTRPFGRVPAPESRPHSLFVTAADSQPLAAPPGEVLRGSERLFADGLAALGKLTDGPVWVCTDGETELELPDDGKVRHERFVGPHPSGTVGVHIHLLDPVHRDRSVWHVGYQDVVAIGHLFTSGELAVDRVVALAGPAVKRPRLLATRLGASLDDLVDGELEEGEHRVISGSVLSGRRAEGEIHGYLGRYHNQVSALPEDRERRFLGWLAPGWNRFSVINAFASRLVPGKRFEFTTSTHGSRRAIVPIGVYEKVMPMDILPTPLLRALLMGDVEVAEKMGVLELDEEDVALLTFVDPGKNDFGPRLREVLDQIEKEG